MLSLLGATFTMLVLTAGVSIPPRFLFAFGDSYTSTNFSIQGTKPSSADIIGNPAFPGQTTDNGANWLGVFLENEPKTLAYNFAAFGAPTDNNITPSPFLDFPAQRKEFSEYLNPPPSYALWTAKNSLFTAWFGINDIKDTYQKTNLGQSPNPQIIHAYRRQLHHLYAKGARRFAILLVPPFNRSPMYAGLLVPTLSQLVAKDIASFNALLTAMASKFASANPDASVAVVDTASVFNPILNNPTAYGAPNNLCHNRDGTSCLWWDPLHPGQAIQRALGLKMVHVASSLGF